VSVRVAALTALRSLDTAQYDQVMRVALADSNAQVRMAAIRAIPSMKIAPAVAVDELMRVATSDQLSDEERQTALASVGAIKSPEAASALAGLVEQVRDGAIRPALQLDVMEAAAAQGSTALLDQLETAGVGRKLERLADTLPAALEQGGSAARGRQTAQRHPAAQCVRCHIIGTGEATVGPNLNGVGARLGRPELLESLL
jgi:hypothetical protein